MSPPPPAPSRIEPLTFPVFGLCWYGDAGTLQSVIAYTGGGGSAKTGVFNCIVIEDGEKLPISISTGDMVGVAITIYKNPTSNKLFLVVGMGKQATRYSLPPPALPEGELYSPAKGDDLIVGNGPLDGVNAVAVNCTGTLLAVGCENGNIYVYKINDDIDCFRQLSLSAPLYTCKGHTKTICGLQFSMKGNRLLSSAKDGTARVWKHDGTCLSEMVCSCDDPKTKAPPAANKNIKRPQQILVRGCAFLDIQGQVAVTVASPRRGKAYLSKWVQKQYNEKDPYECYQRTECSPHPVSSMSLSADARILALGDTNGSIHLWNVEEWTPIRIWKEVHDLPVTGLAVRPYQGIPLLGEDETGVQVDVRSASADSKLACLTLQRKAPKRKNHSSSGGSGSGGGWMKLIHRLLCLTVTACILSPVAHDAWKKCGTKFEQQGIMGPSFHECLLHDFLIAPPTRPGIASPPY